MIGLILAFKRFRYDLGMFASPWVGFDNFVFLFTSDVAYRITFNAIFYSLTFMLITTVCGITLAILLGELRRQSVKVYQTIMFYPHFLSWIVVSYLVLGFLDHSHGFMNQLLQSLGFAPVRWFQEAPYWRYILNIVNLWKGIGVATVIYYAGIMGIDPNYYEAARIDGATKFQMARKITVPMIAPLVSILVILSIGAMMKNDFGLFYFVPQNSGFLYPTTDVIDTYVYRALTQIGDIGMAAAAGLYQSFVGLILVILANYGIRRIAPDNSLW